MTHNCLPRVSLFYIIIEFEFYPILTKDDEMIRWILNHFVSDEVFFKSFLLN